MSHLYMLKWQVSWLNADSCAARKIVHIREIEYLMYSMRCSLLKSFA
jgi:hypothetical protein